MTEPKMSDAAISAAWNAVIEGRDGALIGIRHQTLFAGEVVKFAHACFAAGRASVDVTVSQTRERAAAMQAWEESAICGQRRGENIRYMNACRDSYLAAMYPPTECRLSDGSVMTYDAETAIYRRGGVEGPGHSLFWYDLARPTDTGTDFDALKAFAAAHKEASCTA